MKIGSKWEQKTQMRTHVGQPVVYGDPSQTEVYWADLLVALSRQPRYCGFIEWTILQHLALCVLIARIRNRTDRIVALCAGHDLHEAYVLDIPKGLKECLPGYAPIEAAWERHVHESLGLALPKPGEYAMIKAIDVRALGVEMAEHRWGGWSPGDAVLAIDGPVSGEEERAVAWIRQQSDPQLLRLIRDAIEAATHA